MPQDQLQQIEEKLRTIISKRGYHSSEEINRESDLYDDLGMDSLDRVEFIMDIERGFSMSIHDEELDGISTIGAISDYLNERLQPINR